MNNTKFVLRVSPQQQLPEPMPHRPHIYTNLHVVNQKQAAVDTRVKESQWYLSFMTKRSVNYDVTFLSQILSFRPDSFPLHVNTKSYTLSHIVLFPGKLENLLFKASFFVKNR